MRLNKEFKNNCKEITKINENEVKVVTNKNYEVYISKHTGFYTLNNIKQSGIIYNLEKIKDILNIFIRLGWM